MRSLLQRVILPRSGDPMSVRALYLDEHTDIQLSTVPAAPGAAVPDRCTSAGPAVNARRLRATSRTSAVLPEQSEVSFGAYFNALRRRLLAALEPAHRGAPAAGAGGHRPGRRLPHQGRRLGDLRPRRGARPSPGAHELDLELDLRPFEDGGWYWFDLTTDDDELVLHAGGWYAAEEAHRPGRGDHRHADVQPARPTASPR